MMYAWTKLDQQLYDREQREASIQDAAEFLANKKKEQEKEKAKAPKNLVCKLDSGTINRLAKKIYNAIRYLEKGTAKTYANMCLNHAKKMNEELNQNPYKQVEGENLEKYKNKLRREMLTPARVEALVKMNQEGLKAADKRELRKYELR